MAQTGYTPIALYYSTTAAAAPTAGNLVNGELAINITDKKLYAKDNGGNVFVIADASSGGTTATNLAGGAAGSVPYQTGASATTFLSLGTAAQVLQVNAGATAPEWVSSTGTGNVVRATSPTLVTPTLGVASATSINKVTLTAPATGSTLTIANGKTLTASNTLTFTGTDGSSVAFGTGGTVTYTSNNLSVFAATTSAQLAGVISDETGSGSLVFGTSPTLATPTITTSATVPLLIGGTGTTSTLTLRSTSGVGTTGADIIFQTGNNGATEAMRVLNSGRIGVGTTSPLSFLDVSASGGSTANATLTAVFGADNGDLTSRTNATNKEARLGFAHYTNAQSAAAFATLSSTSTENIVDIGGGTGSMTAATLVRFLTAANNTTLNGSERMRITSSGNVLIGQTASRGTVAAALQVNDSRIAITSSTAGIIGCLTPASSTSNSLQLDADPDNAAASSFMRFNVDAAERMRITGGGDVGIGTATPTAKLDVYVGNGVIRNSIGSAYLGIQSPETPSAANQRLGLLAFGSDTDQFKARVAGWSEAAWTAGVSTPCYLAFSTTPSGSVTAAERMRIDSSGNVLVTGAGGLGYGTGSGGAVTQATSRTTGVTLNKTNGAITLVSAAGSATWQTFTVTNSTVAATDTIIVNQKSGTDLYQIFVTNVAAGSFKITFATTGGTTTEQPVFNFAVIKAVTA